MDPHGPTAQRFPLIARFRPACLPLTARVRALTALANAADRQDDQGLASAAFNQSALVASDVGLPEWARALCHQHADAYLQACPLPGMAAIRALEPVVNLARLGSKTPAPTSRRSSETSSPPGTTPTSWESLKADAGIASASAPSASSSKRHRTMFVPGQRAYQLRHEHSCRGE